LGEGRVSGVGVAFGKGRGDVEPRNSKRSICEYRLLEGDRIKGLMKKY
jgi:hypothetical protein